MTVAQAFEVPDVDRSRLSFGAPFRVEPVAIPSGRRVLPAWAIDAQINWRWQFSNSPDYLIRCAFDPLAFAHDGSPVWRMGSYDHDPKGCVGTPAVPAPRGQKSRFWIAEQDGVAVCHYHSGTIRMVEFEENVTDSDGKIVWIERPDYTTGKMGEPQTRKFSMLATDKQEGYAGRHFDITLADQTIPIWDADLRRVVDTTVAAGTKLRLRGPWHGGAPEGYIETSYQYDKADYVPPARRAWQRKWHQRMGYFGLCIRPDILLDILTTFEPHVPWARATGIRSGEERVHLVPLNPVTGLPKEWKVNPERCPGHEYTISAWATGLDRTSPADHCRHCGQTRDPEWVFSMSGKRAAPIYFDRYLEPADGLAAQ